MIHPLRQFFLTRLEVLERNPHFSFDDRELYRGRKSFAYLCHAAADWLLTPARYLFHGCTVRIELNETEVLVDHVASFYPGGKTNLSHASLYLESGELRSGSITLWRTAVAIVLLLPGCLCAIFFKLPVICSPEIRYYCDLTRAHFTPVQIEVGKKTPITDLNQLCTAIQKEVPAHSPLFPVVETLTIHTENLKIDYDEENFTPLLTMTLGSPIEQLNPKKVIFVNTTLSEGALYCLFSNRKWQANTAITTLEEALADRLSRRGCWDTFHRYYTIA